MSTSESVNKPDSL